MPIPESQLETWCNPGATVTSSAAYNSIRTALERAESRVVQRRPEIYLQGSYGNHTNIRADSDVDIVVQLNEPWSRNLQGLDATQRQAYLASVVAADYGVDDFRRDVLQSLIGYYGRASVQDSNKAILVTMSSGMEADVIPALLYRDYVYFNRSNDQYYVRGIRFLDKQRREIINYPKEHLANGEDKNSLLRTNGRYKETVRMFKNARTYLIDRHSLAANVAPSYFVECLLHNVPDHLFTSSRQQTFQNVLNHLAYHLVPQTAVCQNGRVLLFGTTPEQWNVNDAATFVMALGNLWQNF